MALDIPRLYLAGSPRQMGRIHGDILKDEIQHLAHDRIRIILGENPGVSEGDLRTVALDVANLIRKDLPDVYEEILGISESAGADIWALIVAGGYSDITHAAAEGTRGRNLLRQECTIFPACDSSGAVLLAGTWDSHSSAQKALALIERVPRKGPKTLALTTAGWPMQQGLNSEGLGFAIANLIPAHSGKGVVYIAALPRILEESSLESAIRVTKEIKLCSGRFFAFCDRQGGYSGVETDGQRHWTSQELVPHTNHYIYDEAFSVEGRPEIRAESEERRMSALKRLALLNDITPQALFSILAFHDGTQASISKSGNGCADRTGAAFVIDPTRLALYYCMGPPHQTTGFLSATFAA